MNRLTGNYQYHGCSIIIHKGVMIEGKVVGSYEIAPVSPEAIAARAITRRATTIEMQDEIDANLMSRSAWEHLIEMAKCEIDFIFEIDF